MKISVIVPVYNSSMYLNRCLDSLINQTYKNIEVILVNDGSVDNSLKICNEYTKKDSRIICVSQDNKGVSSARNLGLSIMSGELVSFVDSDDYIEKNTYEKIIEVFKQNSDCDLINFGYVEERHKKLNIINSSNEEIIYSEDALYYLFKQPYFKGFVFNKIFKANKIKEEALTFNTEISICEDLEFCYKYIKKSKKCVCLDKSFYHYVYVNTSATKSFVNKKQLSFIDVYKYILMDDTSKKVLEAANGAYIEALVYMSKKAILTGCSSIEQKVSLRKEIFKYFPNLIYFENIPIKSKIGATLLCLMPIIYRIGKILGD